MSDADEITLSTGKHYAYGKIVGISLDPEDTTIYNGYDGIIGEFKEDGLTRDKKAEIAWLMISRWSNFISELYK